MRLIKLKQENRMYLLLFLLCIFKFMLFGFSYFPILDDFIQYDGYRMYGDLKYVYFGIGTIATRPLASVLDPLFWGAMPKWMALFIVTLFHYLSCVLFYKTAKELNITLGPIFGVIYLLMPVMAESTYWLSASTRIVAGLLLSSGSFYFLARFIKNNKNSEIFGFWILSFLSCGFYETAIAFSSAGLLLLMLYFRKRIRKKWVFVIPFANCAAFSGIYASLSHVGAMGNRAQGFDIAEIFKAEKFTQFFTQTAEIFSKGFFELTKASFLKGLTSLLNGRAYGALIFLCIVIFSCACVFKPQKSEGKKLSVMAFALIMFFVPLFAYFLPSEMWLTFRSFGFSVFALALFSERLISCAKSKTVAGVLCAFLSFTFTVGSVGAYCTYKEVSEQDVKICKKIVSVLDENVLSGEKEAVIVLKKNPGSEHLFYKDFVKSVFYEDWSLTGAVRSVSGNIKIKKITPVSENSDFNKENKQIIYIDENFDVRGEK